MDNRVAPAIASVTEPPAPAGRSAFDFLKHNFREYGMLLSLVAIMVFF